MKEERRFYTRLGVLTKIIVLLFLLFLARLFYVQVMKTEDFRDKIKKQAEKKHEESGERGSILDRHGKQLAFNKRQYTVFIDPSKIHLNDDQFLKNLHEIADQKLLDLDDAFFRNLEKDFQGKRLYRIVAKKVTDNTRERILDCLSTIPRQRRYLGFEKEIEREYYKSDLYRSLIGMVRFTKQSKDLKAGVFGIEKQYENYLRQKSVERSKIYSLGQKKVLPTSEDWMYMNLNGNDVYLTIDNEINYILNDEVKARYDETNADEAYGIIMDPRDGKILATSVFSRRKHQLRNQLFQNQYEPGSIFKPIVVAAAMDRGLIRENSHFDVGDGKITRYRRTIHESSRRTRGVLTTREVLKKSSNVGMVLISDRFSEKEFEDSFKDFGLYDRTGIDFPNEMKPYTISYKKWDKLKKSNMAFGQGVVVTPIQMITAFSAIVNGGTLYRPYLMDRIVDDDGFVIRRNLPKPIRQVIKPEVSESLKSMMEETVAEGTGKNAKVEGYRVGGKTGTAQLSSNGRYLKRQYLASFIGFFPVEEPQYVILVMLMKPQTESVFGRYGGTASAPVVKNIIKRIAKVKNISSQDISKISRTSFQSASPEELSLGEEMPDLKGYSAKQVLDLFPVGDYDIRVHGTGLVKRQKPEKGKSLEGIRRIEVELE